ncbi:hypothetical protein CRYUN_Cryun15aG0065000 [Craigia yunnanensis]
MDMVAFLLFIVNFFLSMSSLEQLVTNATLEEPPMFVALHPFIDLNEQEVKQINSDASPPERVQQAIKCLPVTSEKSLDDLKPSCFRRWTITDYSRAYSSGEITPRRISFLAIYLPWSWKSIFNSAGCRAVYDAVRESSSPPLPMSFFINYDAEDILRQATESTLRYESGEPISALDGVPIAIKDEIDCSPYPTIGGTKWLQKVRPYLGDACCVMHLRSCGAIIVGKTNMHELGAGASGINPHYGMVVCSFCDCCRTVRNPYDPNKIAGGSSSGSAAAGLCPVALGVDGGGSVWMLGFKPTFGWLPHSGVLPLNFTLGIVGILAGTLEDAFIVYAGINGQLPSPEPTTLPWFNYSSDEIRICCSSALNLLCEHYKWKTVKVTIPDIEAMILAHYVTVGSECSTSLGSHLKKLI